MSELTKVVDNTLIVEPDPSDPRFTFLDWNNFNGNDWTATRQDCHQFGEITVITHNEVPTLKLFIAKEIAKIFEYYETKGLTRLLDSQNLRLVSGANLNEIKELGAIFEAQAREISPQGMKLINYAGFNHAMMKSNKPNAKIIQRWVYGNVMPKIAETGSYTTENKVLDKLNQFTELFVNQENNISQFKELFANQENKINQLTEQLNKLQLLIVNNNQININTVYFDVTEVLNFINGTYKIHNKLGVFSLNDLKIFLLNIKFIRGNYDPYMKYVNCGFVSYDIKFTHLGIDFLVNQLKKHGLIS